MSYDHQSPSDRADHAPDVPVADWSGKLFVTAPPPRDREFWIVTDEGKALQVAYDEQATFWLPAEHGPYFSRTDGEAGCYGADEIVGWTTDAEDAEEAARLLMAAV